MQQNSSEQKLYESVSKWLDEYNSTDDKYKKSRAKTLIVTRMLPIVKRIARTIARRSYDPIEDMVQAGSIGLLKAIDSYSPNINDNFKVYAGCLIIGEMKHYLRDKLNTIKVPRHIQELSFRINSFIGTLTMEELNELTNEYVADALNVSPKDVDFAIQSDRRKSTISLEEINNANSNSLSYEELISNDNYKEKVEFEDTKLILRQVIAQLPEEYRKPVELYYYNDLSQKEIAEKLGFTQMQISRKMKKAFALLYKMIADSQISSTFLGE